MMKQNYIIKRLNISPYQGKKFTEEEREICTRLGQDYRSVNEEIGPHEKSPYILISNAHTNWAEIDQQILNRTKLILHPNSGHDNYRRGQFDHYDGEVILGNSIRAKAVAQYNLAAIFEHLNKIPLSSTWDKTRQWPRKLISEQKVLIIGKGHIGEIIASSLDAFGASLQFYDPFKNYQDRLEELAATANIIILACSLNPTSKNILNKKIFDHLKEDALIINGARGKLIEQSSLIDFLENNPSAFCYLDVFEKEPNDFQCFKHLINIKLSSHIAGVYSQLDDEILKFEDTIIKDFLNLDRNTFLDKYKKVRLRNKAYQDFYI